MKCQMNAEMFNFFTVQSSFFCLLPTGLTAKVLRYPSLQYLMDFTQQNVHILCPGISEYSQSGSMMICSSLMIQIGSNMCLSKPICLSVTLTCQM